MYHFDFYRFTDPRELEEAGFREYFNADTVCLVEWPENAAGMLPAADLTIECTTAGSGDRSKIDSGTEAGRLCLEESHTASKPPPGGRCRSAARSPRSPVSLSSMPCCVLAGTGAGGHADLLRARVACADYTRVTLESQSPIQHTLLTLKDPERLVLDLQGVDITAALTGLSDKIGANDPYVKGVRIGRFKAGRRAARVRSEERGEAAGSSRSRRSATTGTGWCSISIPSCRPIRCSRSWRSTRRSARRPPPRPRRRPPSRSRSLRRFPSRTPRQPRRPGRPTPRRLIIVAIDAGHGGEDPGARGRGGTNEKDVTLAIARKLKARIDQEPNMRAVLTRDGDYFVPLHMRVEKARRVHADLFVSVHADAFIRPARERLLGVRALGDTAQPPPRRAGWPSARTTPI